ncbi:MULTISPECIES: EthD family reductase [unclassified Mesorhizobium]|uniref:EthD family reductase n=1 Tax=unclassified Mesorhizobium TaxID=325217 RepID=UPI000BB01C67|nr:MULTISPECIES: EthD family reductase [unclassified Mesorhizobium]PBB25263.1 ethyl tert-butyl ether degradation protein EthD [Mesorhizobium sp. WSM4304]PBB74861.1 ethyl tert-butyl ether degradation protein EthD [Mesorhizobium sp. WSM4308]
MIIVSFLYPNTEQARFDAAYYVEKHVPLALGLLGDAVRGVIVETGLGGAQPGAPAPYIAAFHALFESPDSFHKAFHAHAAEIHGDVPNYTDIAPVVQLGNVSVATLMADAKIISNFTNALAHTELDDPVKPLAWVHPSER